MRSDRAWIVATVATAALFGWQSATVHVNYQGNWTALFCIGSKSPRVPSLDSNAWVFKNSEGYDGQWYRIVAHDPWMQTELWRFVDIPERYQRILLPLIAWCIAFGHPGQIDAAYIAAVLSFLFWGVWITAKWSILQGRAAWWGLGFALLPGTLITLDRMTVDIAEYTFIAAALYCWRSQRWLACWIAAAAAFLTRDLGLLLILALAGLCLIERAWTRALLFASAAIPGLLWYQHVARTIAVSKHFDVIPRWIFSSTLIGPLYAIFHPSNYPLVPWIRTVTQILDGTAISGVILACAIAIFILRRTPLTLESLLCALYVVVFVFVTFDEFWEDPFSYSRAFSPLAGLVAWRGLTERRAWFAIPLSLLLVRVIWQLGPQALGIARFLL